MHRDQKIGLSLAVLIIGFAGAFCFRIEPLTDPHPLALEQAAALDSRIEQLPIRAYTQREGVHGVLSPPELLDSTADVIDVSLIEGPAAPIEADSRPSGDLIELFRAPPEPVRPAEVVVAVQTTGAPPAYERSGLERRQDPMPLAAGERATPRPLPDRSRPSPPSSSTGEPRAYVVKSGDTLTSVSVLMYGTSRRYLELYRANRDVLSDPNDLPVGTTLRIP